jgi:hypothetical protein
LGHFKGGILVHPQANGIIAWTKGYSLFGAGISSLCAERYFEIPK